MKLLRLVALCLFGLAQPALGENTQISFIAPHAAVGLFQLEVRQAPLTQILRKLQQSTGITIHYSVLPEGLLTATCAGSSLKSILECLLKDKIDLIFRSEYPTTSNTTKITQTNLEEVWLLNAKFDRIPAVSATDYEVSVLQQQKQLHTVRNKTDESINDAEQADALIKMAQSKNPEDRAQGIGGLLAVGQSGDPVIKATLEAALSDNDANVRAQAISSFAHRQEEGTEAALQTAMQDSSVDVRIMAVDSAGNNAALLQEALHDQDENVRSLAALKLQALQAENAQ